MFPSDLKCYNLIIPSNVNTGHTSTIDYIYDTVSKLDGYYNVTKQSFGATSGHVFESKLVIDNNVISDANAMGLTPGTPDKKAVVAPVVLVDDLGCTSVCSHKYTLDRIANDFYPDRRIFQQMLRVPSL